MNGLRRLDVFNMQVWMCLRQGALPCLRHIHTRILKTSKRLSPFKRLNAPFYSCSHADSPTDVRSPRVDKTTVLPPTPTQSGLRQAPPATIQCGPRQIQANFNLVIVLPESDSLVTQVDIGGGGGQMAKWATGQNHSVTKVPYVLQRVVFEGSPPFSSHPV